MAAVVQTTLKNNLLSAYNSAKQISGETFQIESLKQAICGISYAERLLGLTPVAPSATFDVRTEADLVIFLEAQATVLQNLLGDADYLAVEGGLLFVLAVVGSVIEYYRIFVN